MHYINTIFNVKLSDDQAPHNAEEHPEMDRHPYAAVVGALHYLADVTWPDISYVVRYLAKFLRNPGNAHWTAIKQFYQYLQTTQNYWLVLSGNGPNLLSYSDADSRTHEGCCAISRYLFMLLGSAISWSSNGNLLLHCWLLKLDTLHFLMQQEKLFVRVPPPILNGQLRPDMELLAKVYNDTLSSPGWDFQLLVYSLSGQ
jgi:hypothetical protein